MRDTLVLHLPEDPDAACRWQLQRVGVEAPVEAGSGPLEDAVQMAQNARLLLLVPAEQVLLTSVELPVRQYARLVQAVPYALEDQLADDVSRLHFALGPRQPDGRTPVAVVDREQIEGWLQPFRDAGLQPDMMIPDVLALPWVEERCTLLLQRNGRCLLRTGRSTGYATHIGLLDYVAKKAGPELTGGWNLIREDDAEGLPEGLTLDRSRTVGDAMEAYRPQESGRIDLLQGPYAPRHASDQWLRLARWPAAMAAGWLLLATTTLAISNVQRQAEVEGLRDTAQTQFAQAFPEITRIVDLRVQAEQALDRLRGGGGGDGFLYLLSQSAGPLSEVDALQVESVQFRDGSLYLSLSGSDLQALERLRTRFDQVSGLTLDVQSAQSGSEGVQIRLKVDRS